METSINAANCDAVVLGTPANLGARIRISKPIVKVRFVGKDAAEPAFSQCLNKILAEIRAKTSQKSGIVMHRMAMRSSSLIPSKQRLLVWH